MKKSCAQLLSLMLLLLFAGNAFGYSVVERYTILEDRFKTQEMMRPLGHDFYLDLNGSLNKNLTTVISDAKDIADGSGDTADKITRAQDFLAKYENTEQTVNAMVGFGIPIFSFNAGDVAIRPNLRASARLGMNMGIRKETLSIANIMTLIGEDIPDAIETAIIDSFDSLSEGDDVVEVACNAAGISDVICGPYKGKYFYPDDSVPNILAMAKAEVKAGAFNDYEIDEHWSGSLNIYAYYMRDAFCRVSQEQIARSNSDLCDVGNFDNSEMDLNLDYFLTYTNSNYSITASVEDVKLTTISERSADSSAHTYQKETLIRLHSRAKFELSNFYIMPFVGLHKRSSYGLSSGTYAGADIAAHLWGERLLAQFRGMVDKEHLTLSPRIKLWLLQVEYSLKQPMKSEVDDVKVSSLHSLNLRLFF